MHEKYSYVDVRLEPSFKTSLDLIQKQYQEDNEEEEEEEEDEKEIYQDDMDMDMDHHYCHDYQADDEEVDLSYDPFNRPQSRLGGPILGRRGSDASIETPSYCQLELESLYLTTQNEKLERELEQSRQTIQALKLIITTKDDTLRKVREENKQAILKVQLMETLILSKHAKGGSVILRSDGVQGSPGNGVTYTPSTTPTNLKQIPKSLEDDAPTTQTPSTTPTPAASTLTSSKSSERLWRTKSNSLPNKLKKKSRKSQQLSPSNSKRTTHKHQRRWSMDFGPKNRLMNDDDDSAADDADFSGPEATASTETSSNTTDTLVSCHSPSASQDSTLTVNTSRQGDSSTLNTPKSRRRTAFIQSLTCHPSGVKHGMNITPPSTPTPDLSDDASDDSNDETVQGKPNSFFSTKSSSSHVSKLLSSSLRIFTSSSRY